MIYNFDFTYWNVIKDNLKKQYPELTNADLHLRDGEAGDFLKMIAYKLGKSRKELNEIISKIEIQ
jgi:hypothetical protein